MQEKLLYAMLVLYSVSFLLYSLYAAVWRRNFVFWGARLVFIGGVATQLTALV